MNARFEDGKLKFDTPVIESMPTSSEKMILDVGKTTLIRGDEKTILTGDEVGFYFKDKKYAFLKQEITKTKFYKFKRFLNNNFKTKFKLEKSKPKMHIIDNKLYEKFKPNFKESD